MDSVPSTIKEALGMFLKALDEEERKALSGVDEDQVCLFHHTWGQDMRNYWSLWEKDTPLVNNFKKIGISHADDMTGILLTSAHRQLNKKPLKLNEQVSKFQEYWNGEIGKPMP